MTDRNELERLLAAATEGPWHVAAYYSGKGPNERCFGMIVSDDDLPTGVIDENDTPDGESLSHDLDLVCFLRNNAPHYLSLMDEVERLRGALADANEALADIRQKPYAPWPDPDPEDTIGSMIDNQAWVMMSHIASFIGHRDGQPDLMEEWQDDWAENYHALFKGWFSPHRAAAKYIADRLTIRRQAAVEGAA